MISDGIIMVVFAVVCILTDDFAAPAIVCVFTDDNMIFE
jgi:hypothetical protein